jgi:ribokinase
MRSLKPVVVVGSINMDLVARTARIPLAGQTVSGTDFQTTPGGKGANQAVAVARLGYPVEMVGMVGAPREGNPDVFGEALIANLKSAGVGTDGVKRVEGPSGVAPIVVAEDGQNCIVVVPGANGKVDAAYVESQAELIRGAGMVLCQLELPLATVGRVLELCAEAGVPVMLDPAPAAALPAETWGRVAWVTPNETEAAFYVGGLEAEAAARELLERGVGGVVLKRGAEGALVAADGRMEWVRAFKVTAVDAVGAGDCFNGAFAVGLLEGKDAWAAARFASAAAAISVTRRGAQASMPTREEVEGFLAERG